MGSEKITQQSVTGANRKFYDAIALDYERIDGRRNKQLESWLCSNLSNIRKRCSGGSLLDLGAGSGLITRCARSLFDLRVATDISLEILSVNRNSFDFGVVSDIGHLPFASQSFDAVTCFSVLHHLYSFESLVSEVSRILKPRGIFYSDHDMDKEFNRRFHALLWLYRKLCNSKSKYFKASNVITPALYNLTEWQEEGINSQDLLNLFKKQCFSVEPRFHWFGLAPLTDAVFVKKQYQHGWAPLFSLIAIKK